MKTIVFAALCFIGFQSSSIAQETGMTSSPVTDSVKKKDFNFYVSFGASFIGDYKLNNKLAAQGLPQMTDVLPEVTFGINLMPAKDFSLDVEATAAYSDEKNTATRVRTATAGFVLRPHYVAFNNKGFFGSIGADLSYIGNQVDIYSRGNVIDLNDLEPAFHSGHISLRNELFYAGPSLALGFLQNTSMPLRLNLGYSWAVTNGKWKSDFADVTNTVNESGHGRAYAKLTLGL